MMPPSRVFRRQALVSARRRGRGKPPELELRDTIVIGWVIEVLLDSSRALHTEAELGEGLLAFGRQECFHSILLVLAFEQPQQVALLRLRPRAILSFRLCFGLVPGGDTRLQ